MKTYLSFLILSFCYYSFSQSIKGVDFSLAKSYNEVNQSDLENARGLFIKGKNGSYTWYYELNIVGYGRSLEKVMDLLEVNNLDMKPDKDRSIIPDEGIDEYTDFREIGYMCSIEQAEILKYWHIHEYSLIWYVDDVFATVSLVPSSEALTVDQILNNDRLNAQGSIESQWLNGMARNAPGGTSEGRDSDGVTQGSWNQGDPDGTPGADRYDTGGGLGEGISFGLGDGRGSKNLEIPDVSGCEVNSRMVVTVDIQVDRDGKVVKATIRSGTYQDNCIWDMVEEAAKKSRFVVDRHAPYNEVGWIRYVITP